MKCLICDHSEVDLKRFSNHLKSVHKLLSLDYTVKYIHNDKQPTCKACLSETRYVSFSFKPYCFKHAKLAMSLAGATGGKAEAWNRGKTKLTDERLAEYALSVTGSNNHFFGKKHSEETQKKISASKRIDYNELQSRILVRADELTLLTSLDDYYSRQKQYLEFKCVTCETVQSKTLQAFERGSRCYKCFPVSKSNWELEVFDFVRKLFPDAVSGDRIVLSPKEIDIFVPSKKIGIECHGLYWHSEGSQREVFDKNSCIKKLDSATEKGVKLIQLFEDEWRDKRLICESMIRHRLNCSSEVIFARKCKVVKLQPKEQKLFFENSHISGYTPSTLTYGLMFNNEIVAALSVRKPRHGKKYENLLEVARFATKNNTAVPGALSRLMKQFDANVMTYVDRRFGLGSGYEACGFKLMDKTGPDYWYTDNVLRYDRFKYRATPEASEREVALKAGVSRIWGCGSLIFVKNVKN